MNKKKEQPKRNRNKKTPRRTHKLKAKILTSRAEKTRGLIGLTKIYPVYFETRFGIHTFGMKKDIDVFILDNKNRVVKIKKSISPGNVFFWNLIYYKVVEAPSGKYNFGISDRINFI
jgi:hypothetical protein